jgi:hypothetical protein
MFGLATITSMLKPKKGRNQPVIIAPLAFDHSFTLNCWVVDGRSVFAVKTMGSETVAGLKIEMMKQGPQTDLQRTTSGSLTLWQVMNIFARLDN